MLVASWKQRLLETLADLPSVPPADAVIDLVRIS